MGYQQHIEAHSRQQLAGPLTRRIKQEQEQEQEERERERAGAGSAFLHG
jgi:ribosomal protein S17E